MVDEVCAQGGRAAHIVAGLQTDLISQRQDLAAQRAWSKTLLQRFTARIIKSTGFPACTAVQTAFIGLMLKCVKIFEISKM